MFAITKATRKIAKLEKKIRAVQGGTSASKTISILLYLIHMAQVDKQKTLTSVVSESMPHLKRGAMRDFKNIMIEHDYWDDNCWNASDAFYRFPNKSEIEFFSADQSDKLRGGRRQRCFINEANNVNLDVFDQLEVRTSEYMFLDWNPTNEFWFYTEVLPPEKRVDKLDKPLNDVEHIILTYKDCVDDNGKSVLPPNILQGILARKNRKGWWKVYGLGLLGEVEGKIYKDWRVIDDIPHEAKLIRYGLDFGYSNDPTAIVGIYKYNSGYIFDEVTFMKGLSNKQIADIILNQENKVLVVADSAEPKSIDEIKSYGVNIIGANKGKDVKQNTIQFVQEQRISYTKRSVHLQQEYRNYLWECGKDGKIITEPRQKPEHTFSHSMDAIAYGFESIKNPEKKGVHVYHPGAVPLNAVHNNSLTSKFSHRVFGKGWDMKNRI